MSVFRDTATVPNLLSRQVYFFRHFSRFVYCAGEGVVSAVEICNLLSRTVSTALTHRCRVLFHTLKLGNSYFPRRVLAQRPKPEETP